MTEISVPLTTTLSPDALDAWIKVSALRARADFESASLHTNRSRLQSPATCPCSRSNLRASWPSALAWINAVLRRDPCQGG